jgi:hypothetical protein
MMTATEGMYLSSKKAQLNEKGLDCDIAHGRAGGQCPLSGLKYPLMPQARSLLLFTVFGLYCLSHIADISSLKRRVIVLSFSTLDILVIRHHFVEIPFQSDWSVTLGS